MAAICLTGKGKLHGTDLPRVEWIAMIERAGHIYTEKAQHADYLVASRYDTAKATNAIARGAEVMTYEDLPGFLTGEGLKTALSRAKEPTKQPAPLKTKEMESNPLWGMF